MRGEPSPGLADRLAVFSDQVLAKAEGGERDPPGSEVFDAVLGTLVGGARGAGESAHRREGRWRSAGTPLWTSPVDLALHDAIARRLAWRDSELRVLGDAREVCGRLLVVARTALPDPNEEMEVALAVAESGSAAARILIILVLGRIARERAALLREELAQERLNHAIERQRQELDRLERALAEARRYP